MNKLLPCPFCGGQAKIIVMDDEFNIRDKEYEKDAWSGLKYGLSHITDENDDCPIATYRNDLIGVYGYDTREEVIDAWNTRK